MATAERERAQQEGKQMNSTGRLSSKASNDAAEWALKRKEQMERARAIREERKSGGIGGSASSSVFKNVGQEFVHRQSSNGRSQQHTQMSNPNVGENSTATSMISTPSIHGGRQSQEPFLNQMGGAPRQQQFSQLAYQSGFNQTGASPNYMMGPGPLGHHPHGDNLLTP